MNPVQEDPHLHPRQDNIPLCMYLTLSLQIHDLTDLPLQDKNAILHLIS